MNPFKALLIIGAAALTLNSAFADDGGDAKDDPIKGLCTGSPPLEGSAEGTVVKLQADKANPGKSIVVSTNIPVRMNLFCITPTRLGASAYIPSMPNPAYVFSRSNGSFLTLSQFSLAAGDRAALSSTNQNAYVKLNIAKLKAGSVRGYFLYSQSTDGMGISGELKQSFPAVADMVSKPVPLCELVGGYDLKIPVGKGEKSPSGFYNPKLWFDVPDQTPVFNLVVDAPIGQNLVGGPAHEMSDGPTWDGKTGFQATTPFGGDPTSTGVGLWHIRGFVEDVGKLQIWIVDPINGIRGPMQATRNRDPFPFLEMGSACDTSPPADQADPANPPEK